MTEVGIDFSNCPRDMRRADTDDCNLISAISCMYT